jgi:hypothetical protein
MMALRGCYFTMKIDPSVLCDPDYQAQKASEEAEAKRQNEALLCNYNFTWKPRKHVDAFAAELERGEDGALKKAPSPETADAWFTHITNYVSRQHGTETRGRKFLELRSYLDVEVTDDQRYLLQPTASDVLVGHILEDSIGENAKKKIAKRRIDFINGNVAAYSRSLNNPDSLAHIADTNQLSSTLATIAEAKEAEKQEAKKKKAAEQKSKKKKASKKKVAFEKAKAELNEGLKEDVTKGIAHVRSLAKSRLQQLLKYYFEDKTPNQSKMKAKQLLELVEKQLQNSKEPQQQV